MLLMRVQDAPTVEELLGIDCLMLQSWYCLTSSVCLSFLQDAPTIEEYLDIFDAPLNLDLDSEQVCVCVCARARGCR